MNPVLPIALPRHWHPDPPFCVCATARARGGIQRRIISIMRTILVIDDEQPMLRLIRSALKGLGFEVLTSESGTEGLEIIRNVRPALVISDLHMGEMDGLSVLAATREQPETRAIPFIFMTGDASTASYRRGMEMGADDFLIKPFDADQLRRSVESRFTRLKGVSAEIEQARDRLFSMMDAMPNLVAVAEGDALALTYLNPYGRDLLELSADEKLAGLHLFDFLPGWALAKALHEAMPDTLRDGSWTGEMALTGRRGCEHHVSMQWVQNGTNPDGEPCIGLIARDITEQRRQKAGLERGEELFRVIAENAADIIALLDPAGQSLFDSSAGKPVLGYDQSQLHARWLWEAVHKEDADKMICAFQDAVNAGIEQRIECRLRHQDGSWRVFEFYYGVLRNEEKGVERVLMTARDITQRKAAEERLRNSEALYQSLVDNLPQNIFRKDREGRFTFANERFGRLLHRTPAEIVGCCDQDFYPPELADKFRADD
ncbi:MAG TPA: hypothetical protein DCY13_03350, partial [Verrucomicrobiales bacterium]|nr:hypothetical protein [Verrucomicrobiales bacterium]